VSPHAQLIHFRFLIIIIFKINYYPK
jgi:hypothetical protein